MPRSIALSISHTTQYVNLLKYGWKAFVDPSVYLIFEESSVYFVGKSVFIERAMRHL